MRKILAMLAIIAIAVTGIAIGQNFVNQIGGTPLIKDLGNLTMQEIDAIFSGDGAWLDSQNTPSIDAFLKVNRADGEPIGNVTPKHAYLGSSWKGNA